MNKTIYVLIIIMFVSLMGCDFVSKPKDVDTDGDGVNDVIYVKNDDGLVVSIHDVSDVNKYIRYHWDNSGDLKRVESDQSTSLIVEFYKPSVEFSDGKIVFKKQEMDNNKSFEKIADPKWLKNYKGQTFVYVKDKKIVYSTLDENGDSKVDSFSVYDSNGRLVKYFNDSDFDGKFNKVKHYKHGQYVSEQGVDISVESSFDKLREFGA